MNNSSRSRRKRVTGFTLIELLVVIAIIAILAAILLPVFAAARERTRQSSCSNNEKQMGIAMMQYNQDWDEKFPCGTPQNNGQGNHGLQGWASNLYPYVKTGGVFTCPDDPFRVSTSGARTLCSYAINMDLKKTRYDPSDGISPSYAIMYGLSDLKSPSLTITIFEYRIPNATGILLPTEVSATTGLPINNDYQSPFAAPGAGGECNNGSTCNGDGSGVNWCGGAVTGILGTLTSDAGRAYVASPNCGQAAVDTGYVGVHTGGANYLFADGHVKALKGGSVSPGSNNATIGDPGSVNNGNGSAVAANTSASGVAATFSIY